MYAVDSKPFEAEGPACREEARDMKHACRLVMKAFNRGDTARIVALPRAKPRWVYTRHSDAPLDYTRERVQVRNEELVTTVQDWSWGSRGAECLACRRTDCTNYYCTGLVGE